MHYEFLVVRLNAKSKTVLFEFLSLSIHRVSWDVFFFQSKLIKSLGACNIVATFDCWRKLIRGSAGIYFGKKFSPKGNQEIEGEVEKTNLKTSIHIPWTTPRYIFSYMPIYINRVICNIRLRTFVYIERNPRLVHIFPFFAIPRGSYHDVFQEKKSTGICRMVEEWRNFGCHNRCVSR